MIYFDNAATTYPKPESVIAAVNNAMKMGVNVGRGSYNLAAASGDTVFSAREEAARQFGAEPENIVFTKNCTEALNLAIKGIVLKEKRKPIHIITTDLEHNSVLRPIEKLKMQGLCEYSVIKTGESNEQTINSFFSSLRRNTRLIVMTNASNAFGTVLPVAKVGKLAKERGIYFMVDCAQTAGNLPITIEKYNADILCMPGHKGLFGPMGTGMMILRKGLLLETILEGGTGSYSSLLTPPEISPDRYEAGTINLPGIAGLREGLKFSYKNREAAYLKEMELIRFLYKEISLLPSEIYTPFPENYRQMPLLSFNIKGKDSSFVGEMLAEENVAVRTGFHCAYLSHKHFGTAGIGTIRISLSRNNTKKEAEEFIYRLKKVLNKI